MKKQAIILLLFLAPGLFSVLLQCTPYAEKKFNSGSELYKKGEIARAGREFEAGVFSYMSKAAFSETGISSCGEALFIREDNMIKLIYPLEITIKAAGDFNIISYDAVSGRLAASNGIDINIYNQEGKAEKIISPAENDGDKVMAILLNKNNIIYFIDSVIYSCDINSAEAKSITEDKFYRPYKDPFHLVFLKKSGENLAVIIGIAGIYHLSVVDLNKNKTLIKDKTISASKIYLDNEYVYYISGQAGKWALNKISLKTKKSDSLAKLDDISDIEYSAEGLLYENSGGLWFYNYGNEEHQKIPFKYSLAGSYDAYPLLKYEDDTGIADMKIYLEKVGYLKENFPRLFILEEVKEE